MKRKTQKLKFKLRCFESLMNAAISDLSSCSSCSLWITVRESHSTFTSLSPSCIPRSRA
ncbi:hypothetical protein F383_21721 [Gossypium arboreum]|uniref:Uncharacterized protein n=1 Tax=Gossypium arboreum TaxID=29729 RepID=A0A0B0NZ93_GOSAR|nr:hypothetical protein F383_21721 [Gossypium arboreum]KHG17973.1 hypothetical protein F383_21721 [Gossypium arboreum]